MKNCNPWQWLLKIVFLICIPIIMGLVHNFPDPTRPPNFSSVQSTTPTLPQEMILTAVFIYPSYKLAIVNGQPIKVGDQIGEYTVTNIDANTVQLERSQDVKETLQLVAPVKQPH